MSATFRCTVTVDTFSKFEATSSSSTLSSTFAATPIYIFKDTPQFLLEGLPSADKQRLYEGIHNWMTQRTILNPFNVDVAVLAGDGSVILTWEFIDCRPIAFGTYVQDVVFLYQFVDQERSEIRDRAIFECAGVDLRVPEN